MLNGSLFVLVILVAVIAGIVIGFVLKQLFAAKKIKSSESLAARIVEESKKEAETIKKEAVLQVKENLLKIKADFDKETKDKKNDLDGLEKRIRAKEENLDKRIDSLAQKESNIEDREKSLIKKENAIEDKHHRLDNILAEQKEKLEGIAGISSEEAKKLLIQSMEADAKRDAALIIRKIEDEAKFTADRKSREIVAYAIQRYAGDVVAENTVSAVNLPSEEMKGRIIGREGRNIRAIEAATGIDLIVDDTPEAVVLSSFDPIRREVARISLERLIQEGRIHPGRIEEIVKKVKVEVDQIIRETGEKASFDVGVHDIHPDIINLLGSLKYRRSYSQNVLQHSVDVAYLTGMMAAELKMNVKEAKRAGLLHDIGKAIDQKAEGTQPATGPGYATR